MTHLYMIRHGEADSNVRRVAAGPKGDLGLTNLGRRQAERLRDRLAATGEIAADVLIASTLERAAETARIIAPALGLPIEWDDEVQELRVGEADGMLWDDAVARFGMPSFRREPYRPVFPGGENWGMFVLRVATAIDRITSAHEGKTIVVVCHAGVIDAAFLSFAGVNMHANAQPLELSTHNTSITHWERREKPESLPIWRLISYNDVLHVQDIDTRERIGWVSFAGEAAGGVETPQPPLPTEPNGADDQ